MPQYTAEEKAAYYRANPEKLAAKLKREANKGKKTTFAKKAVTSYKSLDFRKSVARRPVEPKSRKVSLYDDKHSSLRYFSPFGKTQPIHSNETLGNSIALTCLHRQTIPTINGVDTIMAFVPSITGRYHIFWWNGTTGVNIGYEKYQNINATPPTDVRLMRAGIRLHNTTSALNANGVVRVLQISAPLAWDFVGTNLNITTDFADELLGMCSSNPKSREFTSYELSSGLHEFVVAPATYAAYHDSHLYTQTASALGAQQELIEASITNSMNTVIMVLGSSSPLNQFSVSTCTQFACRYPANEILNDISSPTPKMDKLKLDKIHEDVSKHGAVSTVMKVADGGVV